MSVGFLILLNLLSILVLRGEESQAPTSIDSTIPIELTLYLFPLGNK